ncbi:MAG: hypothetical protein QXQ64_08385 [Candidatus Bathyarchaeia archaeon]
MSEQLDKIDELFEKMEKSIPEPKDESVREKNTSNNLIAEFVSQVSALMDTPDIFITGIGYWLTSSLLGEYLTTMTTQRPLKPNIYLVLSSKPGTTRRSTLLSIADDIMIRVYGEDIYGKRYHSGGSKEGLIDGIMDSGQNYVHIFMPEFGVVLDEFRKKDWMSGIAGLISKLYYGETWKEEYSKRFRSYDRYIRDVYATLIGDMQETGVYIDPKFVKQGLMRRLIFLTAKKEDFKLDNYKPLVSLEAYENRKTRNVIVEELTQKFKERRKYLQENLTEDVLIIVQDSVERQINEIDFENWKKAIEKYESEDPESYLAPEAEKLLKLTLLEALADLENKVVDLGGTKVFNILPRHLERALKFYEIAKARTFEVFSEALNPVKPVEFIPSTYRIRQRIKNIIDSSPGRIIMLGMLEKKSNLAAKDLKPYLLELYKENEIGIGKVRTFRKPAIYIYSCSDDDFLKIYESAEIVLGKEVEEMLK